MRRWILAIALAGAVVVPGIAAGPHARRPGEDEVRPARPGAIPGVRPPGPRSGAAPEGVCAPAFERDVTSLFVNEPTGVWEVISADCGASAGCNDFFDFVCDGGGVLQATFCSHGGSAAWDTNLSVWEGTSLAVCEDSGCGPGADLVWPVPGFGGYRLRIGGTGGASGSYSLAVNMPSNCFLGVLIPVGLQEVSVD